MPRVLLDSDFLSSFLKIERLPLVREFYQTETLLVPAAVYREVAVTTLLPSLTALDWVKVETPEVSQLEELSKNEAFSRLGTGEKEAIALARSGEESILLMNDKEAIQCAEQLNVTVVNIPAFLLACKQSGLTDEDTTGELVTALQERDHFGFHKDVLALLLKRPPGKGGAGGAAPRFS